MAIRKEELHPETNSSDIIYPKTSSDQIADLYKIRNMYISSFYEGGATANVNSPIGYYTITLKDGDFVLNTTRKWLYYRKDGVVDYIDLRKKLYYEHRIVIQLNEEYYSAQLIFSAVNGYSGRWDSENFFSAYPDSTDTNELLPLGLITINDNIFIIVYDRPNDTIDYIGIADAVSYNDEVNEL